MFEKSFQVQVGFRSMLTMISFIFTVWYKRGCGGRFAGENCSLIIAPSVATAVITSADITQLNSTGKSDNCVKAEKFNV